MASFLESSPKITKKMEILSNGEKHETVPENFILPPNARPAILAGPIKKLPVVHLDGENQREISRQIIDAGKEYGFFQVVGHGVSEQVTHAMMDVAREFFDLPMEDKARYYSDDRTKIPRLFTGLDSLVQETRFWRDCLRLGYYGAGDEFMHMYPDKPSRLRDVTNKFGKEVAVLGTRILRLMSQGLGLDDDYFDKLRTVTMNINNYPPCPDPSLTLGLPKHCDPNIITLLLQGEVSGLQVLHDGGWLQVDPIPNAFVVNFGHMLEIMTNGVLRSVEHRAVTNTSVARTTIAAFFMPAEDCPIAPARSLVAEHPDCPLYKSLTIPEFFSMFLENQGERERMLDAMIVKD